MTALDGQAARPRSRARGLWIGGLLAALALAFVWHLSVGAKAIPLSEVVSALLAPDPTVFDHAVVRQLRLPRAVYAVLVGAALSVAGALMQGVTRNPLAEPSLLGLMAGAALAVVLGIGLFGAVGMAWLPLVAALGSLAAAALVWTIAGAAPGGATPLTLVLSGAVVTAFLTAFITLANLLDEQSFDVLRVWMTGSLAGRKFDILAATAPWIGAGLIAAVALAPQVSALALGEETAIGLGISPTRVRTMVLGCVVVLTAASVAIAGPLGFVGLVVPHVVRMIFGQDYRWVVPGAVLVGALYLLVIDCAARLVLAPMELSTGIATALMGAPVFVWLVRTRL